MTGLAHLKPLNTFIAWRGGLHTGAQASVLVDVAARWRCRRVSGPIPMLPQDAYIGHGLERFHFLSRTRRLT